MSSPSTAAPPPGRRAAARGKRACRSNGRGGALEKGLPDESPVGLQEARGAAKSIVPRDLQAAAPGAVIFVDTSQEFARGHVPGARWVPRGWLGLWVGGTGPG